MTSAADVLREALAAHDLDVEETAPGRFVVVLPGTTAAIGLKIAERLRQKVAEWNFGGEAGRIPVTVSIGMATKKPGMSSHTVFEQADNAMYRAKQLGRNNVQAHGEPEAAAVKFGG